MFKKLMKKQFIKVRDGMYQNDLKNIEKQKDNTTIDVSEFQYFEDNHPMHKLNIYTSKDLDKSKSYPLIIDIHGGGWIYGDKDLNGLLAMEFASKGYIVMTMSYRLILDNFTICDMLFDINEAITYIVKNASNFNIDLNKVGLMGDSAGGHLALLISAIYNSTFLESTYKINKANIKFQNIILNHPAPFIHTVNLLKDKILINKFIERYFYDPEELDSASGDEGRIMHQTKIDAVARERKYLLTNTAAHLLQVTATLRREIPVRTEVIDEMFKNTPKATGELEAISSYSATRIENMKALLMYAKLQSARLQYMAARELLNLNGVKTPNGTYKDFDLEKYILTKEYVDKIVKEADTANNAVTAVEENYKVNGEDYQWLKN